MRLKEYLRDLLSTPEDHKITEDDLFEMANLRKSSTGLPVNIYISSGGAVKERHGPRLKAMILKSDKFDFTRTISIKLKKDIDKDDIIGYENETIDANTVKALRKYINLNLEVLMKYWDEKIDTTELVTKLKKIS
jgi:hypothetical protein